MPASLHTVCPRGLPAAAAACAAVLALLMPGPADAKPKAKVPPPPANAGPAQQAPGGQAAPVAPANAANAANPPAAAATPAAPAVAPSPPAAPAPAAPPPAKQATKDGAKPAPATAAPVAVPALRADARLAALVAAMDRALAAQPTANQDLSSLMLITVARNAVVSVLHGHFAFAGLGQAVRTGGMAAAEVAVMARTMAQNYRGLSEVFGELSTQKPLQGELADLFRSVQILAQYAEATASALAAYAATPNEVPVLQAFEVALEDYRSRLQALFAHLGAQQQQPAP